MDANQIQVAVQCSSAVIAIGLGAWTVVVASHYAKWASQLGKLAARVGEHEVNAAASITQFAQTESHSDAQTGHEEFESAALPLESVH